MGVAAETVGLRDVEKAAGDLGSNDNHTDIKWKRKWYGKKYKVYKTVEEGPEKRPTRLFAPVYNGLAAGLAFGELKCRTLWSHMLIFSTDKQSSSVTA